jgi:hypothetical protein
MTEPGLPWSRGVPFEVEAIGGVSVTLARSLCFNPAARPVVENLPLNADFLSLTFFLSR